MSNNFEAHDDGPRLLLELYESDDLLGEGLLSFEYPLYHASDEELDYFIGSAIKRASRAASGVARSVARAPVVKAAGRAARTVGRGINTVSKVVPVSTLTSTLSYSPLGLAVRAGVGAASAAARGKNVFHGAVRSVAASPAMRFAVDTGAGVARGKNVFKAAAEGARGAVGDLRESLRFAAMVAPFVPGVGSGVAAALGAANALAAGERITDAVIAAGRSAIPGGVIAQAAFDVAANLAKGKNIGEAALNAARSRVPGGPAAQAAFDTGVALMKGKSIQDSVLAGGGRLLPKSPFAADAVSFVRKAASGQNLGRAALSSVGNMVMKRVEQKTGPIISANRRRLPAHPRHPPQPFRRLPRPQREAPEGVPPAAINDEGTWTRRGGYIIVLGA